MKMTMKDHLPEKLKQALAWREQQATLKHLKALRLFCGASDGVKGLWIDRYGSLVVISLYDEALREQQEAFVDFFAQLDPELQVMFKLKTPKGFVSERKYMHDKEFYCEELSCRYKIKTDIEHDFGLFIDTFSARQWLSENVQKQNVLNLFAYTCAFAVVGKKYGAAQVTNIDPNQDYLNWGKQNAELNQLDFRNLCDPAQKYLPRHIRRLSEGKDQVYDIVIADPPAFLVGRGDDRLGRKLWPKLLEWFLQMQTRQMVLICNDRSFRNQRDLREFFNFGLKKQYRIEQLQHRKDVLGQNFEALSQQDDYLPPDIFVAVK